jgi:hypothetical protein
MKEVNMSKTDSFPRSSKKPNAKDGQHKPADLLPGMPGYRTRDGRTGLDPIDMRTEAAHTAGTLLYKLLRGRIRKPLSLVLLGALGLVLIAPLVLAILDSKYLYQVHWDAWAVLSITAIAGIAVLINFVRNLVGIVFR